MEILVNVSRGVLGILAMLAVCYLLSKNRKLIDWKLVGVGMASQLLLAILILKVPYVNTIFDSLAGVFARILRFSESGAQFLFGDLVTKTDTSLRFRSCRRSCSFPPFRPCCIISEFCSG